MDVFRRRGLRSVNPARAVRGGEANAEFHSGWARLCGVLALLAAIGSRITGLAAEGTGASSFNPVQSDGTTVQSASSAAGGDPDAAVPQREPLPRGRSIDYFLDNLMRAESGGQLDAQNPRSTALGPYQFIESTFLYVVKRYFGSEVTDLTDEQILALRTNFAFSRRAASAYTRENAAYLRDQNLPVTHANLRLAYLVGPSAAVRLLKASLVARVTDFLSAQAIAANPFLAGMSVADLLQKAARDIGDPFNRVALRTAANGQQSAPDIEVKCNLGLPSCRKWLALARKRGFGAAAGGASGSGSAGGRGG